jgi:hypothetical protein
MLVNHLLATLACPRCGYVGEVEIEAQLDGRGPLRTYRVGDTIVDWNPGITDSWAGRPALGNAEIVGYVECERCRKDYFVDIVVAHDVIRSVSIARDRPGYVTD